MEKCSKSLWITEIQIKTTLRYHIKPIRLSNVTKQGDDKCWRKCGRVGTLIRRWWSCELIQTVWRAIWNCAQRATRMCIPFHPAIPLLRSVSQRDHKNGKRSHLDKNIYISSLCGGQDLKNEGMPINWGMVEQDVIYECTGILLGYKK